MTVIDGVLVWDVRVINGRVSLTGVRLWVVMTLQTLW